MTQQQYETMVQYLTDDRIKVSESKRKDYTKGSENVLQNFYNQAEDLGITPLQSLGVHMEKQMSATLNYIKTDGQSESEPIIKRIGDAINYLELMWCLINDEQVDDGEFVTGIDYEYSVGDKVKVIDNFHEHRFDIGEIVELIEETEVDWLAGNDNGVIWFLTESEFIKV